MAIDRLINSTQGDSIIAALNAISSKVGSPYNLENKLNPAYINYDSTHAATPETVANSGITSTDVAQIETNKNNISSVKDHYKYYDRTLFEQESIPTGTIAYGSTWVDGKAVRTYNQTTNIVGGVIEQGSWNASNLIKEDSTNRCRLSNSITVQPSTTYTITLNSPTINNARLLLQYRDSNDYTSSESGWQATLPYTFTTPSACHKATIIFSNTANTACTPTDFGNLQINEGNTALSYEVPSWSTSSVDDVKKNEANILSVADQSTQYNIVPIKSAISTGNSSVTAAVAEDKTITITITGTTSSAIGFEISDNFVIDTTAQYVMTGNPSAGAIRLILQQAESPYNWIQQQYNNQAATATPSVSLVRYYVYIYANSSGTIKLKPMLIPKAVYDAGFTGYQPFALPNTAITPALKECVDNGSKNKVYTDNSGTFTASGSSRSYDIPVTATGNIAISFGSLTSTDTDTNSCAIVFLNSSNVGFLTTSMNRGSNVSQTVTLTDIAVKVRIYPANSYNESADDTVTWNNLMICDESLWKVSRNYQLPALSNAELTELSKWNYTETRFTNTGTSDYENTGISFTAPANQSIEFYAYDRKDGAYLDKILVCDSLTTLGNTTIVSANSIIDGFTDAQYWTLQTTGIVPTFNTDVTYYIWVKRKSTGSNLVGLAWRYLSQ